MRLIVPYTNDERLIDSDYDVFLIIQKGINSHYQQETKNVKETIDLMHQKGKLAFGWINRFIFEPEMQKTVEQMMKLINAGVDGFIVNDFGLLLKLRELKFEKEIILSTDTTITNKLEVDFLIEEGFDKVMSARELTLEELIEIGSPRVVVPIFGHQIISTSRRQLLSAYGDLLNQDFESNHVYQLKESTRQDHFLLIQDETGTHIFDQKVFVGFEGLSTLLDTGIDSFFIDHFNLSTSLLILVAKLLVAIKDKSITPSQALHQLMDAYPNLETTSALWYLKTTDKKE